MRQVIDLSSENFDYDLAFLEAASEHHLVLENRSPEAIVASLPSTYSIRDPTEPYTVGQDLSPPASIDELESLIGTLSGNNPSTPHMTFSLQEPAGIGNSRLASDIPHSCLAWALNIIPTLQVSTTTCALASVSPDEDRPISIPHVESTVSTNRAIVDSIILMISCNCSLDEYLASIICIIVFQLLASYAAATKEAGCISRQSVDQIQSYLPNHLARSPAQRGSNIINAQLILGELQRIVSVVDSLGSRFKELRPPSEIGGGVIGLDHLASKSYSISASVFTQLESDLRRRLRDVTNEIIEIIRGE